MRNEGKPEIPKEELQEQQFQLRLSFMWFTAGVVISAILILRTRIALSVET